MASEFLPCPHCRGDEIVDTLCHSLDVWAVWCVECRAQIRRKYRDDAVAAWNRRVQAGPVDAALLDAAKEYLRFASSTASGDILAARSLLDLRAAIAAVEASG